MCGFLDRAAAADVPTMSRTSLDNASIGKHAAQRKLVAAKILTHDDMRHRSLLLFRIILESESQATRLGTQGNSAGIVQNKQPGGALLVNS